MQLSKTGVFQTTNKMLLTTHWSIFELRFDTVGLLVWDNRHITKMFVLQTYLCMVVCLHSTYECVCMFL